MTAPLEQPLTTRIGPRLLDLPAAVGLDTHLARFGPPPTDLGQLIAWVDSAGLRGRGGARFPTAIKLAAVARRRRAIVVVNATEGEPASIKDKALLHQAPHLVLDGAAAAGAAVGAREIIVAVERSAVATMEAAVAAADERRMAGLERLAVRVVGTPSRYVAGEETALVHWLNGGEAKPTLVPPRPFERGVSGRPTLVDNVETLAHLALIARFGPQWYRRAGTAEDPGTTLVTVTGAVTHPGVYEVEGGSSLAAAIEGAGSAMDDLDAVLVGGHFGSWISATEARQLTLGAGSLGSAGAALGCGALVALPRGACGVAETARITRWMADQNAGQCGPCVHGLPAMAEQLTVMAHGGRAVDQARNELLGLLPEIEGRGACRHPDGVVRLVRSALRVFATEIAEHHHRGPCAPSGPWLPTPSIGGWR